MSAGLILFPLHMSLQTKNDVLLIPAQGGGYVTTVAMEVIWEHPLLPPVLTPSRSHH